MLKDLLRVRETGMRKAFYEPVRATFDVQDTTAVAPYKGGVVRNEYTAELCLGTNFWATPAEREDVAKSALRRLQHALFDDVISDVLTAKAMCFDPELRALLDRIHAKMIDI